MADDGASVRTPTQSELNTFKVLANMDFTNFAKADPGSRRVLDPPQEDRLSDHRSDSSSSRSRTPDRGTDRVPDRAAVDHRSEDSRRSSRRTSRSSSSVPDVRRPDARPDGASEALPERNPERWPPVISVEPVEVPKETIDEDIRISTEEDVALEKEALLYELEIMEKQGTLTLHRKLTMNDSLEAIQYQYDRANMIASTQQSVEWAKTALKMGSTVLEAVLKRFGVTVVDGFSNNLCKDMHRFNKPLTKLYRKHWRRGTSSPEMELGMIVMGALVMTVVTNKGLLGGLLGGGAKPAPEAPKGESTMKGPGFGPSMVPPSMASMIPSMASMMPPAPSMPSAGPSNNIVSPAPVAAIPDWAKAALAGPLGPEKPAHFATGGGWPEERRPPPPPMIPVSMASRVVRPTPVPVSVPLKAFPELPASPELAPEAPAPLPPPRAGIIESAAITQAREETVRRLTLASPKSNRRKKETPVELNLDD